MTVSDYSTTPGSNTSIGGINIAEGCAPGGVNNAFRQMMADLKALYNALPDTSTLMPKSGSAFTGNITYTGRGAYRHNNDPTLVDGRTYWLPEGSALPASPAEGMEVVFYTP